ncbi:13788_t:CDS:2, partial [Racocetra fulgida]
VIKKTRNPYLILKFYNDLFFAKIAENSDDVAAAKIDNALKRIPAYKVGIAYCELTRKGYYLDVWTYNRLIDSVCKSDDLGTAWKIIEDMIRVGVHPDIVTFNILLNRQISRKDWSQAVRILDMIHEAGLHPSESTLNTLTRNKLLEKLNTKEAHEYATTVLKRMSLFNRLEWFSVLGSTTKLIQIYQEIITSGQRQNSDKVKQLYDEMCKLGTEPTLALYNILIGGFVKLEDMDTRQLFEMLLETKDQKPNLYIFNSLISGYANVAKDM